MKHIRSLMTALVITVLMVTGCKEDFRSDSSVSPEQLQSKKSARLSAETKARISALRAKMPTDFKARLQQNSALLKNNHSQYRDVILRAMHVVEPTPCGPTAINTWLNEQLQGWDEVIDEYGNTVFDYAIFIGMLDFPTFDALYFENSSSNQYFGVNGEYSQKTTKAFKDLNRFWNIQSNDMVLGAMHGSMLRDREKVIRIDKILFGDSQATAEYFADLTLLLLEVIPQYRNGDHPIFTFNAFALEGFEDIVLGSIPDKIIMGDGIIDAYVGIGYGDVASQAVLAHEYGHHIQFQLDLFGPYTPESTRRTELMADAYSAYYLSHARGATMQWKRVKQFLQVFFAIGDCGFTNNGHHGTPLQRMAAAEWGYSVADNAKKQGHILPALDFANLFEAQLPIIVAPVPIPYPN